jgi:arabinofuranan 3-O-arabinosyltransferase
MSDSSARFVRCLLAPRALLISAWVLAIGIGVGRIINGHLCFQEKDPPGDPKRRIDGNNGHIAIDFGGQWMMGRMLALGHGDELYSLPRHWEVADQAYPRAREAPAADKRDSERLIRHFMGKTDRRWGDAAGSIGLMMAPSGPLHASATATATQPAWDAERLEELAHPKKGDGVGGPLYPPIQAFVMLPFATGDHPQAAYFAMQYLQVFLCFLAGLGVSRLSRGRIWWPVAVAIILAYPGSRGTVDLGQNSALTLTLLIWGWVWIVRDRPTIGGIIWGLLAFKPVWALSFFCVLLLMRQWRAAAAMVGTGLLLIAATLPFVGLHSWFQWLTIGQEAARIYSLDINWIALSRDVLGLPRRILLDFNKDRDQRESVLALVASWALWAFVVEITVRAHFLICRKKPPLTGPFPAMIILAAWLCTYHFMYYDSLVSAFGVFVLLADPRPFFRARAIQSVNVDPFAVAQPGRRIWLINSFVLTIVALMLFHENVTQPLKLEGTWVVRQRTSKRELPDGTTEQAPRIIVGTSDNYPWDTVLVGALWLWCWGTVLAGRWKDSGDAPQLIEGNTDVGGAH